MKNAVSVEVQHHLQTFDAFEQDSKIFAMTVLCRYVERSVADEVPDSDPSFVEVPLRGKHDSLKTIFVVVCEPHRSDIERNDMKWNKSGLVVIC
jgi:hypothetical protein